MADYFRDIANIDLLSPSLRIMHARAQRLSDVLDHHAGAERYVMIETA